jgi:hypothetical protein
VSYPLPSVSGPVPFLLRELAGRWVVERAAAGGWPRLLEALRGLPEAAADAGVGPRGAVSTRLIGDVAAWRGMALLEVAADGPPPAGAGVAWSRPRRVAVAVYSGPLLLADAPHPELLRLCVDLDGWLDARALPREAAHELTWLAGPLTAPTTLEVRVPLRERAPRPAL